MIWLVIMFYGAMLFGVIVFAFLGAILLREGHRRCGQPRTAAAT